LALAADTANTITAVNANSAATTLRNSNNQVAVADSISINDAQQSGVTFNWTSANRSSAFDFNFIPQACRTPVVVTSGASINCAIEVRPNQLVITGAFWYNSAGTITDSKSLAYSLAVDRTGWGVSSAHHAAITYAETGAATGTDTVTLTFAAGSSIYPVLFVNAVDNVVTSSPLDTSGSATGTGTALSTGNITTTAGGDLLYTLVADDCSGVTLAPGSGYSFLQGGSVACTSPGPAAAETQIAGAAGTYSGTYTAGSSIARRPL
jgi:hypothetical protein